MASTRSTSAGPAYMRKNQYVYAATYPWTSWSGWWAYAWLLEARLAAAVLLCFVEGLDGPRDKGRVPRRIFVHYCVGDEGRAVGVNGCPCFRHHGAAGPARDMFLARLGKRGVVLLRIAWIIQSRDDGLPPLRIVMMAAFQW